MTDFGVYLPVHSEDPPSIAEVCAVAVAAEEAGFSHVWAADHLTWNRQMLAPVPALSYVAAGTSTIGLGIGVYLLPLRNPALAAKDLATLDHLSGGRLLLGVGIGGENPDEYLAANVSPRGLGKRLDDSLAVVTALFEGSETPTTDTYGEVPASPIGPRPVGHVPLWVGGRSKPAIDRAARVGDGWFAMWVSPRRVAAEKERVLGDKLVGLNVFTRVAATKEEADLALEHQIRSAYQMSYDVVQPYALAGAPADIAARIAEYVDAGVTDFMFNLVGDDQVEQVKRLQEEVLPLLGAAA